LNQHGNHNVGGKVLTKGMEIQAQSKRQRHYAGRRRSPRMVRVLVLLAIVAIFLWVAFGWGEPV